MANKEVLVVASKIKQVLKDAGCQGSGTLAEAVSDKVHELLKDAVERARENQRKTVRPYDL